jgi:hypothetical protein
MRTAARLVLIFQLVLLGACESDGANRSTTPTSDFFSLPSDSAVIATVRFKSTASISEMSAAAERMTSALNQGSVAGIPTVQARYEQYLIAFAWRSVEAGMQGESTLRELLAGSMIVDRIEVTRK